MFKNYDFYFFLVPNMIQQDIWRQQNAFIFQKKKKIAHSSN